MPELRWILLGVGVVAIAAIWWWSTRRSGQAPGQAELRETTVVPPQGLAPDIEGRERVSELRGRGISPLEPLSIHTSDFEPVLDLPEMGADSHREPADIEDVDDIESSLSELQADVSLPDIDVDAGEQVEVGGYVEHAGHGEHGEHGAHAEHGEYIEPAEHAEAPAAPAPRQAPLNLNSGTEHTDALAAAEPNADEQQKIISMRVCAVGESRWSGRDLSSALEGLGLAFGRYQVFHRKHADGRSIFFVASLIEPGTFDAARMDEEEFRGVSLFAVLPGPLDALQTVDALLATARELARDLSGTVQDGKGMPFSPQRVAALREDVARFQSLSSPYARQGGPTA